jgi:hypothetical protein
LGAACGRSHDAAAPIARGFAIGHWRSALVVEPGHAGVNQVHLTFTRQDRLADDIGAAVLDVVHDKARFHIALTEYGDGHYASQTAVIDTPGQWVAFVDVTGKDGNHYAHRTAFTVRR